MQEMVYLKAIQKSPMSVSVSGTTDQKTYLKKFRGGFSPLRPTPGSAYGYASCLGLYRIREWIPFLLNYYQTNLVDWKRVEPKTAASKFWLMIDFRLDSHIFYRARRDST